MRCDASPSASRPPSRRSTDPDLAGPELLPVRLARACARTLAVDDAEPEPGRRARSSGCRSGASSDVAEVAERLQFTVGAGPCMTAQETRQPVFAVEEDLRRRWPVFTELLFGATPFRAVVALPLQPALAGRRRDRPLLPHVGRGARPRRVRGHGGRRAGDLRAQRRGGLVGVVAGRGARVAARTGPAAPGGGLGGDGQAERRPRGERPRRAGSAPGARLRARAGPSTTSPRNCSPGRCARRNSGRTRAPADPVSAANGRGRAGRPPPAPPAPPGPARPRPGCRRARRSSRRRPRTRVPSTATTSPSTAMRTARSATSAGSCTRAPGSRRGTSVPVGGVAAVGEALARPCAGRPSAAARSSAEPGSPSTRQPRVVRRPPRRTTARACASWSTTAL